MRPSTALLALALVAAAAASASAQSSTSGGFRTCSRISFDEDGVAEDVRDGILAAYGARIVVRRSPGKQSKGVFDDYTRLPLKEAAVFNTKRDVGQDEDLGSPNFQCRAECPPGFEHCAVCFNPLRDPAVRSLYLPDGHPGCGTADEPDFKSCPGIGCGGGFWKQREASTRSPFFNYPVLQEDGTYATKSMRRKECELVLDDDSCPVPNEGMNCREAGNVLIVQENPGGAPDDDAAGGVIQFIFESDIELIGLSVLDLDESSGSVVPGYVYGMKSADEAVNTEEDFANVYPLVGLGDNSLTDVEVDAAGLRRVVVWLRGSGSVNDIEFCGGRAPTIEVTTAEECKYSWSVEKTVNQEQWDLFAGDKTSEVFTTTVTRSEECESSGQRASGTVTVGSPDAKNHRIVGVLGGFDANPGADPTDAVSQIAAGAITCSPFTPRPDRPFVLVSPEQPPVTLGGDTFETDNTLTCSFAAAVDDAAITADSSFLKLEFVASPDDDVFNGGSISAFGPVSFDSEPVLVDATAVVTETVSSSDPVPAPRAVSSSVSWTETREAPCLRDTEGVTFDFTCTSTVTPDDSGVPVSDSADTSRRCYDLQVEKTTEGSAHRHFTWVLEKTATPGDLDTRRTVVDLDSGDGASLVQYRLEATATSEVRDYVLAGTVSVEHNHPTESAVVSLFDQTFKGAVFEAPCAADGSGLVVAAGAGAVSCAFTVELAAAPAVLTNVAVAEQQFGERYSASADFTVEVERHQVDAIISDQFEGEEEAEVCRGSAGATDGAFTCHLTRNYRPATCDFDDDIINERFPNVGRVRNAANDDLLDSSNWDTRVTTICVRCADCDKDTAPMYPAALDSTNTYSVKVEKKFISLCWD